MSSALDWPLSCGLKVLGSVSTPQVREPPLRGFSSAANVEKLTDSAINDRAVSPIVGLIRFMVFPEINQLKRCSDEKLGLGHGAHELFLRLRLIERGIEDF